MMNSVKQERKGIESAASLGAEATRSGLGKHLLVGWMVLGSDRAGRGQDDAGPGWPCARVLLNSQEKCKAIKGHLMWKMRINHGFVK